MACAVICLASSSAQATPHDIQGSSNGEAKSPGPTRDPGADLVESINLGSSSVGETSEPYPAGTDIVEAIDGLTSVPTEPAPVVAERFELHGWARQLLEVGRASRGADAVASDPLALPYDGWVARTQLLARAKHTRGGWFEASISGLLSYGVFGQELPWSEPAFDNFSGAPTQGRFESHLRDLWLGFYSKHVDFRIGQQRLSWGRAEFISPNGIVNPRDSRDPFLSEPELRVQPSLLARVDVELGFGSLQVVAAPFFTPDRFDISGSNWAALQPRTPAGPRGLVNLLNRSVHSTVGSEVQDVLRATQLPRTDLTEPVAGARFSWSAGGVDVNHYYQYGFDGPLVAMDDDLAFTLSNVDFGSIGVADLQPIFEAIDLGRTPLRITYVRRHHVGFDLATAIGPIVVRMDAAYQSNRVFFRRDIQGTRSPALQGALALEYQGSQPGQLLLVEGLYIRPLDEPSAPLLFYDRNSFGVSSLVRWTAFDPVSWEVRAMAGVQPYTLIVQPQVNFEVGDAILSLGGLWLTGERWSFGDYFSSNDSVYAKAKFYF